MQRIMKEFDFEPRFYEFTNNDFAKIAAAVGIPILEDYHKLNLQKACDGISVLVSAWIQGPRPADVRKILRKIHSDAGKLMKDLHSLHVSEASNLPARQVALYSLLNALSGNDWTTRGADLLAFTEKLVALRNIAENEISNLSGSRGGRPEDFPLKVLVQKLAPMFKEITGKGPTITTNDFAEPGEEYSGKFVDLIEAFIQPLSPDYQKIGRGQGKPIQRILAKLRS